MGDKQGFMAEFEEQVTRIPDVERVEFFGSVVTDRFEQGRSDIDVAVFGTPIPDDKHRIRLLVRDLSKKYNMKLGSAPFLHPTPFFVRPEEEWYFRETFDGHLHLIDLATPIVRLIKRFPPMTYRQYWRLEEKMMKIPFFTDIFYTFW